MLSGVLNSEKAINMNIAIMRAFVERALLTREKTKPATKVAGHLLPGVDVSRTFSWQIWQG